MNKSRADTSTVFEWSEEHRPMLLSSTSIFESAVHPIRLTCNAAIFLQTQNYGMPLSWMGSLSRVVASSLVSFVRGHV